MKSSAKKVPSSELSAVWKIDRLKTSLQKPAVVYSEFMWPVYLTHALCVDYSRSSVSAQRSGGKQRLPHGPRPSADLQLINQSI